VYNSSGELVKVILVTHTVNPVKGITGESDTVIDRVGDVVDLYWEGVWYGSWDGTNLDGKAVANGEYYVKVDSVDTYGVANSVIMDVTVNRKVARLDITIYNASGEAVRHLVGIEAAELPAANQAQLSSDTIEPGYNGSPSGGIPSTAIVVNGVVMANWDGRNDRGEIVESGTYYVEIRSEGDGGSETVVTRTVNVVKGDEGNRVSARPNALSALSSVATFVGPAGSTVKVVVYTTAGEKVAQAWGAAGTGQAVWDSTGAASGFYLVVATVVDPTGHFAGRSVLKMVVQ
jgi:flagellar hook assembly protein FlgD